MFYSNRGISFQFLSLFKKSISDFDKAIDIKGLDESILLNRGVSKYMIKDTTAALADWEVSMGIGNEDAKNYYNAVKAKM